MAASPSPTQVLVDPDILSRLADAVAAASEAHSSAHPLLQVFAVVCSSWCSAAGPLSLRGLRSLTSLDLSHQQRISRSACVALVRNCPNLQHVNLGSTRLAAPFTHDDLLQALTATGKLRTIDCQSCNSVSDQGILGSLQNRSATLLKLSVSGTGIGDLGFWTISLYCPALQQLDAARCNRLTELGLQAVALRCVLQLRLL